MLQTSPRLHYRPQWNKTNCLLSAHTWQCNLKDFLKYHPPPFKRHSSRNPSSPTIFTGTEEEDSKILSSLARCKKKNPSWCNAKRTAVSFCANWQAFYRLRGLMLSSEKGAQWNPCMKVMQKITPDRKNNTGSIGGRQESWQKQTTVLFASHY